MKLASLFPGSRDIFREWVEVVRPPYVFQAYVLGILGYEWYTGFMVLNQNSADNKQVEITMEKKNQNV